MKIPKTVNPTEKMKRLYKVLEERWGEVTDLIIFDGKIAKRKTFLPFVHIAIWKADENCDVTTFNSLGMSEKLIKDSNYYVEFNFAVRDSLNQQQTNEVATFIADLAEYPFINNLKLDWFDTMLNPYKIPMFSKCNHLLLLPSFVENGLDRINDKDGLVKLLYIVPITTQENLVLKKHGLSAFNEYIYENDIDILSDRK